MAKKVNVQLDASMLDMFQLCQVRFKDRYILNKITPVKQRQLDRGTLVHAGMEVYYKGLKDNISYDNRVNEALRTIKELGVSSDLPADQVGRIVDVVEENLDFWRVEDQNMEVIAVETPFTYLLHEDENVRIFMSGKIDLLVNTMRYMNHPIDHKSYDRSYETRRLTNQFMNYCYGLKSNFLTVNKIGFQTSLKPEEKYKRPPMSYDPMMLEEWKENVIKIAYQYLSCISDDSWAMNLTSCDKYNRLCEYYEVCESSGKEAKFYKLEANYVEAEPWDVTKTLIGNE